MNAQEAKATSEKALLDRVLSDIKGAASYGGQRLEYRLDRLTDACRQELKNLGFSVFKGMSDPYEPAPDSTYIRDEIWIVTW